MGPARSVSPRLIIPGPRARVARCQCSSDIHESRGASTCFRMRVSRMVHYGPHQAVPVSDATPIARGSTPLTIPILTADTVVSLRSVSAGVARADLPYFTARVWPQSALRRLGSDPSVECIYTTVDVAAVQLNLLSMDPRHLPAPPCSDGPRRTNSNLSPVSVLLVWETDKPTNGR
jgi:hypothetical protein